MTARDRLDAALTSMAANRQRPRCGDAEDTHLWLSEKAVDRALAASYCGSCVLIDLCLESAIEEGETWTTRGGRDFRADPIKKSKKKREAA